MPPVPIYSARDALQILRSPYAHEEAGPLFLFELPSAEDIRKSWTAEEFCRSLLELPAATCAIIGGENIGGENPGDVNLEGEILSAPDIILSEKESEISEEAELLKTNTEQNPIASLALVQLLRMSQNLDVRNQLIVESLTYSTLQSGEEFRTWLKEYGRSRGRGKGRRKKRRREPAGQELSGQEPSNQEPSVLVERSGEEMVLTFNRAEKHNAFSAEMRDELAAALRVAYADSSIKTVRLGARGKSFSSGGDLDEFGTTPDPAAAHRIRSERNVGWLLHLLKSRVKVEVQGACIGAGAELPAFTENVAAKEDAFFQLPEIGLGLVPGAGGTSSILNRIGRQKTAWLALTKNIIGAERALAWGLIDRLHP